MEQKKSPFYRDYRKIEAVRNQMVQMAMQKGLTHPSTIRLSQKLDGLLNGYSRKSMKWPKKYHF